MLFNSFEFLLFLPVVVFLYFLLPYRYRWVLLLAASYYFYMSWEPGYVVLIIASTLIDYFAAGRMAAIEEKKKRRPFLYLSLLTNLGLLFAFKYYAENGSPDLGWTPGFIRSNLEALFNAVRLPMDLPLLKMLLPVGISFYTFQTLSYTIDVYNGKMQPEKHLGIFAVFVSFFPQLVAGPIERAPNLLPQFRKKFDFDSNRVRLGLLLMLWGFFKKMVIADRVAGYVNTIYEAPGDYNGLVDLVATYFFAFQIFCDFSGYSDIAIGSALIMGYSLMTNFRRPYFAFSIQNFWQRWHISLSTWFRDYVYIPLGGNRTVKWRWYYNLFLTFLISGLWHGANWTFVVWGGIHGFLLVFGIWTMQSRNVFYRITGLAKMDGLRRFIQVIVVFHLVIVAWVFFRAENAGDAFMICRKFLSIRPGDVNQLIRSFQSYGILELVIAVGAIGLMEFIHFMQERGVQMKSRITGLPAALRWSVYVGATMLIILFGKFSSQSDFIYFQF